MGTFLLGKSDSAHISQGLGSGETKEVGNQEFPSPTYLWVRMRSQEFP